MEGWGKLIAGALIGVAGTVYATNEEFRKRLPGAARDLPAAVRGRFTSSVVAAREASARRRAEILRDLEDLDGAGRELRGAAPNRALDPTPPEPADGTLRPVSDAAREE